MKPNQLATLVLKLIGIYCLTQVIPVVSSFISLLAFGRGRSDPSQIIFSLVAGLLLLCWFGGCILLIVKSGQWGEKLVPANTGDDGRAMISSEQVQVLAFAVAGVVIFAEALPQLFSSAASFFVSLNQTASKSDYLTGSQVNIWRTFLYATGTLVKAALGLWMFFGARGFADCWRSLRTFGTPKPPQS